METKIDYNSIENQEIKSKFVQREVLTCFSYEMDALLKVNGGCEITKDLPTWDYIENVYEEICPNCGEPLDYEGQGTCPYCKGGMLDKNVDMQPKEIYEWWIVTEYLYNKLRAHGEPVLEWGNNCYWGRCTTGQSIMLDHVIGKICEEMEILDGQKYSWGKK